MTVKDEKRGSMRDFCIAIVFISLVCLGVFFSVLYLMQWVATIRYQTEPPNVNCSSLVKSLNYGELEQFAFTEYFEKVGFPPREDVTFYKYYNELSFEENMPHVGAYICFCNH